MTDVTESVKATSTEEKRVKREAGPSTATPAATTKKAVKKTTKKTAKKAGKVSASRAKGNATTADKKTTKKKVATTAKSSGKAANPTSAVTMKISPADRHKMVEVAAYRRAQQRGFVGGDPHDDWLAAEGDVDAMLAAIGQA